VEYEKEMVNNWNLYTVHGEISISEMEGFDKLSNDIKTAVTNGEHKFCFDFTDVPFIDSAGLSIIIMTVSSATRHGSTIKISGLNEKTEKLFDLVKMHRVFEFFDTKKQALESIE
jgi:anti-anti-sigma factor